MKKNKLIFFAITIFISLFFINNVSALTIFKEDGSSLEVPDIPNDILSTTYSNYTFLYSDNSEIYLFTYATSVKAYFNSNSFNLSNFFFQPHYYKINNNSYEYVGITNSIGSVSNILATNTNIYTDSTYSTIIYESNFGFTSNKKLHFYEYPGIDSSIPAYYSTLVVAFADFYKKDYKYYYSAGAELDRSKWTDITNEVLATPTNPQFVINTYTYQEYFFDVRDSEGNIIYHTAYVTTNTKLSQGYKHYIFPAYHTYAYISNTIKGTLFLPKDNDNHVLGIYNYETKTFDFNIDTIVKKTGIDWVSYEYDISSLTNSILVLKRTFNDLDTSLEVISSAYVNFTSPVYDENGNFIVPGKYQDPSTGDIIDFETPTQVESQNKGFFDIIYNGVKKFSNGLKSIFSVITDNFHLLPNELVAFISLGLALFFIALIIALLV